MLVMISAAAFVSTMDPLNKAITSGISTISTISRLVLRSKLKTLAVITTKYDA